jgi:hypothetical protein
VCAARSPPPLASVHKLLLLRTLVFYVHPPCHHSGNEQAGRSPWGCSRCCVSLMWKTLDPETEVGCQPASSCDLRPDTRWVLLEIQVHALPAGETVTGTDISASGHQSFQEIAKDTDTTKKRGHSAWPVWMAVSCTEEAAMWRGSCLAAALALWGCSNKIPQQVASNSTSGPSCMLEVPGPRLMSRYQERGAGSSVPPGRIPAFPAFPASRSFSGPLEPGPSLHPPGSSWHLLHLHFP